MHRYNLKYQPWFFTGAAKTIQLSWNAFVSRIFPTSATLILIRQPNVLNVTLAGFTWQAFLVEGRQERDVRR